MPELLPPEILAELFEASARRTPHAIALIDAVTSFTYEKLNTQIDSATNHLLAHSIGGGDMVGLWLTHGIPLLVMQLAIAKTGAAWLPMDADTPAKRMWTCLENAAAKGLISSPDSAAPFASKMEARVPHCSRCAQPHQH